MSERLEFGCIRCVEKGNIDLRRDAEKQKQRRWTNIKRKFKLAPKNFK